MYLARIEIENFRIFGSEEDGKNLVLPLRPNVNILVGENNSGKTAVIDAIRLVLGTSDNEYNRITSDDFHFSGNQRATNLSIKATFKGLSENEAASFLEYVNIYTNKAGETKYKLEVTLRATRNEQLLAKDRFREVTTIVTAGMGDGNNIEQDVRALIKATYLKPLRDAQQELTARRNSRLSHILLAHKNVKNDKDNLERIISDANKEVRNSPSILEQIGNLNSQYLKHLTLNGDTLGADLKIASTSLKNILEKLELYLLDDILDGKVGKKEESDKGLNAIVTAENTSESAQEVKHLTQSNATSKSLKTIDIREEITASETPSVIPQFDKDEKIASTGAESEAIKSDNKVIYNDVRTIQGLGLQNLLFMSAELLLLGVPNSPLSLLIIEEPEAHLHPQLQLRLMNFLETELTKSTSAVQVIFTTHSPNLTSKAKLETLIVLRKGQAFSLDKRYTKLNLDYDHLHRFLDATKANLFFARGVLIVEGDAENILLPAIGKALDYPLDKFGVSIVKVGHTGLFRYSNVFLRKDKKKMPVNVACITDIDIPSSSAKDYLSSVHQDMLNRNQSDLRTKKLKKKTRYDKEPVQTFVSDKWTLEYDIACTPLGKYLHAAIQLAIMSKNLSKPIQSEEREKIIQESIDFFEKGYENENNRDSLSAEVFQPVYKKKVSKAVVAQILAELIENKRLSKEDIPPYLFNAIRYAATGENPAARKKDKDATTAMATVDKVANKSSE